MLACCRTYSWSRAHEVRLASNYRLWFRFGTWRNSLLSNFRDARFSGGSVFVIVVSYQVKSIANQPDWLCRSSCPNGGDS